MRRRLVAALAGGLLVAIVATEVLGPRVAGDQIRRALERCAPVEDVEVRAIARPILPRLVAGRARDVEVVIGGLQVGDLRVEQTRVRIEQVLLPWAPGRSADDDGQAEVALVLREADLQAALAETARFGVTPVVELGAGQLAIGITALPARVEVGLEVRDGVARLRPGAPVPTWFRSLGLDLQVPLPDDVELEEVRIEPRRLEARVVVTGAPGLDGTGDCGPLDRAA